MQSKHKIHLGIHIWNAKLEGPLGRRLTCQVSVLPKESKPTLNCLLEESLFHPLFLC